ncbi:MAG TPA: PQQ-dependent sugar dehydrogenase [Nitrospiria bacterium]|jgi:glucose/arabinose dehydrogenase|nr:PQQ-dependent sugar dehydrogenase [Nitrospiria bacterium]
MKIPASLPSESRKILPGVRLIILGLAAVVCASLDGCMKDNTALKSTPPLQLELVPVATGFSQPLDLQAPDDDTGRLFVVEQGGKIRIISSNGQVLSTPFLDISGKLIGCSGEEGLLGLAFHPNYATDARFFVNYTRNCGGGLQTVIAEYAASTGDPNLADATSERILLTVDQPYTNHNGGGLAFGNDGFLYIGLGDGGSGGDPLGNGQDTNTLLGKILRIDVDSTPDLGLQYAIPPDNPFVNKAGLDEIWLYGLRNPFRFSVDSATGDLWIGDVGQDSFEEVDRITPRQGGANLGWNIMEGTHCFNPPANCPTANLTLPIFDYPHDPHLGDGTVIGGYVYHGTQLTQLAGAYIFGDFLSGRVWTLTQDSQHHWMRTEIFSTTLNDLSSFGQGQDGELYVVRYSSGSVAQIRQIATM